MNDRGKAPFVSSADRAGTGLEFLQKMVSGEYANLPIGDHLGFRVTAVEKGRVTVTGKPDERSYNLLKSVHGGWTAAVLDTAMALSNLSLLAADQSFTTLDIRINYLRPVTLETGEVTAHGNVLQSGRKIAYCEAKLVDGAGKLLAHGTGSLLILPR
ncbi:MAG: PaaI family thioesterase [Burkholderiales bacterium]|nr:PaaI family thioesterase [Burkholderiales bacterium]